MRIPRRVAAQNRPGFEETVEPLAPIAQRPDKERHRTIERPAKLAPGSGSLLLGHERELRRVGTVIDDARPGGLDPDALMYILRGALAVAEDEACPPERSPLPPCVVGMREACEHPPPESGDLRFVRAVHVVHPRHIPGVSVPAVRNDMDRAQETGLALSCRRHQRSAEEVGPERTTDRMETNARLAPPGPATPGARQGSRSRCALARDASRGRGWRDPSRRVG